MFNYDRLDQLVKETGKKKNYLSVKMGFSGRYLNDARKQNTDIKGHPLQILADELGTTAEYLCGESDQKEKSPTSEDVGLIPGYSDLSEENKVKAREYIALLLGSQQKG